MDDLTIEIASDVLCFDIDRRRNDAPCFVDASMELMYGNSWLADVPAKYKPSYFNGITLTVTYHHIVLGVYRETQKINGIVLFSKKGTVLDTIELYPIFTFKSMILQIHVKKLKGLDVMVATRIDSIIDIYVIFKNKFHKIQNDHRSSLHGTKKEILNYGNWMYRWPGCIEVVSYCESSLISSVFINF